MHVSFYSFILALFILPVILKKQVRNIIFLYWGRLKDCSKQKDIALVSKPGKNQLSRLENGPAIFQVFTQSIY